MSVLWALLLDPQRGASLTEFSQKEMLPFRSPPTISKIPSRQTPRVPQRAPANRNSCLQTFLLLLSVKAPGKRAPLHVLQQGPHWERSFISRDNGLFVHLYLCESPIRSPPSKNGENIWSPFTEPHHGRKAYIQWGAACFPKGIVYDTAISTPVPCSLQHDTFHLDLGRPEPR
jgi:hypothetical protein